MDQKPKTNPQRNADPYTYASLMGSYIHDRNPIQVLVGDIQRMISVVTNLGKTKKLAQQRIDQLQSQVEKVQSQIADVNPKQTGNRIDRLR